MHADAPDREPHSSGSHGEPHAGLSQMAGGSAHSIIEDIRLLGPRKLKQSCSTRCSPVNSHTW